jgi:hypothetical protein
MKFRTGVAGNDQCDAKLVCPCQVFQLSAERFYLHDILRAENERKEAFSAS